MGKQNAALWARHGWCVHDLTAGEVTFPRPVCDQDSWETGGDSEVLSRMKELPAADGCLGRERDSF